MSLRIPEMGDRVRVTLEKDIVRAAFVTEVHEDGTISCSVMLSSGDIHRGAIDLYRHKMPPANLIFPGSRVPYGETPYTWHWPMRS